MSMASSSPNSKSTQRPPQRAETLRAHFGEGMQHNYEQRGRDNRQINVDTIGHYHEAPQQVATPLPTHTIPFPRDDDFVERSELAQLEVKLSRSGTRVALYGLGGIGKSQLAIEYCYRQRDKSSHTWVLWAHASTAERFDADIRKLAGDVRIPGIDSKDANVFQLVYGWLADVQQSKSWLVVLDNADEATFLFEAPPVLGNNATQRPRLAYLPFCSHGKILVTTRSRAVALRITDSSNVVDLKPDAALAIALLQQKLEHEEKDDDVATLASALENMPLAVAQAAAYINRKAPRCSIQAYMKDLEKSERSKMSLLSMTTKELRRDFQATDSILLTWQISFEHIHTIRPSAAERLSLMSFFNHQGIPEFLVKVKVGETQSHSSTGNDNVHDDFDSYGEYGLSDDSDRSSASSENRTFDDDVDILRDYSFLSVSPDGSTFEMHRLVQLATQMWLRQQGRHSWWETHSLSRLDVALPVAEHAHWKTCQMLYPHVKLLLDSNLNEREALLSLASISFKAAWFAWTQGLYQQAEAAAKRSESIRERILGREHSNMLSSTGMLATVLQYQGKYEEAEAMHRRALKGREKVLGEEHPDTLMSISNLATVLGDQGNFEEAEAMHRRALKGREKVLGQEHPHTLVSIGNLAFTYKYRGWYKEAEELEVKVLKIKRRVLGEEHPDTLVTMSNLASTCSHRGRYKEAEELEVKVLEIRKRVLGDEHPGTLTSMNNLALTYSSQKRHTEAEQLEVEVLEIRKRVLGDEHPDTLMSMNNLAATYYYQDRFLEARALNLKCLKSRIAVLGETHPYTRLSVWWLEKIEKKLQSGVSEDAQSATNGSKTHDEGQQTASEEDDAAGLAADSR